MGRRLGDNPALPGLPRGQDTLTNPATGTTITINVAGPAHITDAPSGFTFIGLGTTFWFNHPVTGEPGLFLSTGRFVFSIDAAGNESFQIVGHITSLCPQLA